MEFEKINKIKINGNIFNNSNFDIFPVSKETTARIANLYGKNGSGKSTIAKAIKYNGIENVTIKYYDKDNNEIICDSTDKIYVYNEEFIDENIKMSETGIKTIIMLGEQKELDDKIIVLKDELKELKENEKKCKLAIEKFENPKDISSPQYYKNLIEQEMKKHWAVRDKEIKNNKKNTTVQYNELIAHIINEKDESTSEKDLLNQYSSQFNMYKKVNEGSKIDDKLEKITIFSKNNNELNLLLKKKIDKPQFTDREQLILEKIEKGEQKFYESVRDELKDEHVEFCPYCFQSIIGIKEEVISSINKVLNKEVDLHKEELQNIKESYVKILDFSDNFKKLDDKLLSEANSIVVKLNNKVDEINKKIDDKINNIYTPVEVISDEVLTLEKNLNDIIEQLEIKKNQFNKAIEDRKNIKSLLDKLNLQISWYEINENYKILNTHEAEYNEMLLQKEQISKKVGRTQSEITKLESEKRNVKIANDKINVFLEYIFMSNDKIRIEYDNIKKIYLIKSHGQDIKPKDLSIGERNIIALCYFFTKILENTSEGNEFKEDCFIVLDDPISSFDIENKVGIYTFLRMIFSKVIKNNPNSKIINFTHSLEAIFNLEKVCSDIKIKDNFNYSILELKNSNIGRFEYKKRNDYKKMLEDIYDYAQIEDYEVESDLDDTIGNTMRKLLEAYATFNYNKGVEEITKDDRILEKIKDSKKRQYFENFMYRLILNNESHTFDETRNLDFFDYTSREEKVKTARRLLVLLNILDDTHLKSYFDNEQYITKLNKWENEIIS